MPYELIGKGTLLRPDYPRVRLAWQAKLTAVSASRMAKLGDADPELSQLLHLHDTHYAALLTH
jgi:hypothetical protein